jgi:predicted aspartyl protease
MTPRIVRTLTACAFPLFATTALADDCGPLKMLTSVDLKMAQDGRAAFVPVTLQGHSMYMLLDTGGAVSEITASAVASLGLESREMPALRVYDIKGNHVDHATTVPHLTIGDLKGDNIDFVVGPDDLFRNNDKIAGILGPAILRFYDVAIDFADRKLTLFSQDHCEGKVIYWSADAVAAVPMQVTQVIAHIVVPVVLDGQKLNAVIDTGTGNSVLNLDVAENKFGLGTKQPDMVPVGALGDSWNSTVYRHTFKSLAFEGIAVGNPTLDVIPDLERAYMEPQPPVGTLIRAKTVDHGLPDMLIGMDILSHLHLYIAYKEEKLYITPASTQAAVPANAAPAVPAARAPVAPPTGPSAP